MSGQSPEIVATASLSPLSPAPISVQSQTTVVPRLHDQAAGADDAASDPITVSSVPQHPVTAMEPEPESEPEMAGVSDTIVVGGDDSDESHDESDDSIDYGESAEGQEQEQLEPDAANDDYAKSFDSPTDRQNQSEADEVQPDVSMATESMSSSSAPDPLTSQSSTAAASSDHPSPRSLGLPPTNASAERSSEAPSSVSAPAATPPSTTPATAGAEKDPSVTSPPAAVPATAPTPAPANDDASSIDIQKLVDGITAKGAATASLPNPPAQASPTTTTQAAPAITTPSYPASLPPKPSLPLPPNNLPAIPHPHHSFQTRGPTASTPSAVSMTLANPAASHGTYMSAGPPGVATEGVSSLPPPPPTPYGGVPHAHAHLHNAHHMPVAGDSSSGNFHGSSIKQLWEIFQADEKRYTSEAKWERFPEGSRIFIGNLSSERVSKREVFDVFHRFGRLAQISLKNAYGFVQYHTVAEGQAAMQGAQGIELGGRKIHLEISRTQKKKDDRDRSPDRRTQRGVRGNDRYENGDRAWRRDDYRPGRSPSPRRTDARGSRDSFYSRDRDLSGGNHDRRRSRSPARYNRYETESYRRRSPSPHRRTMSEGDRLDIPRRFGSDVPDVQVLLLQEISRDFVSWVQGAFHQRGLKTDVMYLNPRFPRDAVVQRQIVEGVHAIVDLDYTAQSQGKIPIQVFYRSGGSSVRFELYKEDPAVAAEIVLREKAQSGAHLAQARPPYASSSYSQPYPAEVPPVGYQYPYSQPAAPPQVQPAAPVPDLTSMVGQLDNSALQALLASLQTPQANHAHAGYAPAGVPAAGAPQAQIDVNALLGNLRNAAATQATPVPGAPSYGVPAAYAPPLNNAVPNGHGGIAGLGGIDTAQQVQTIIDQLKRAAQ